MFLFQIKAGFEILSDPSLARTSFFGKIRSESDLKCDLFTWWQLYERDILFFLDRHFFKYIV